MKAIDIVRQMVADGQVSQEVAAKYFPELAESEEERIRKEIVRFIQMEVEDEIVGNKWLAWLEKQGKQKPANWSKEDKANIDVIVSRLEADIEYWESRSKRRIDEDKRVIVWLKSLRPQSTWKPSDEQMGALWDSIKHDLHLHPVLKSLYNDLKKLRED